MKISRLLHYMKMAALSSTTAMILCLVLIALCFPGRPLLAAAGTAAVSVSAPSQPVSQGSQFTVNIVIQPNNAIAGSQFNLTFNPALITVNSVTEGNLLNQNGGSTYFSPGTINNTNGTITGVAGAITTPGQTVSAAGIFAVITMTAGSTRGSSALTLSNVIVGDINGQILPFNATSSQVAIDRAPVLGSIGNQVISLNSTLSFTILATDADGDTLIYTATGLPSGASFNSSTRVFSWTPSMGQVGTYTNVHFEVTDGIASDYENIIITVNKLVPVFSNLSAPSITSGVTPTSLSGTLKSGSMIPTGSVSITLNGITQSAVLDGSGNFNSSFVTSALTTSGSPYSIGYVYAGDTNFVNVSDTTKSFTVNKIAATITLSNLNQTYDGTAKSVTVTTNPAGLSYSLTYNGSGTAPTAAGTYSLVATVTNTNYSGSTSGSLVIAKVTPAFSNLSAPSINSGVTPTSLGGTLKSGSLIPSGSVSITLNGVTQSAALDGSGNFTSSFVTSALTTGGSPYSISYVYAGDTNFINVSDNTKSFTVNKIAATITLSNLSQIYDGTAKSVTVTTNPAGLSYSLTYNGSGTAPTAAGTYSLVATITNVNYSGSASGSLVIAKVTPAFTNLSAPNINSGVTPTSLGGTLKFGSLIPSGSVSITLNGVTQSAVLDGSGNFTSSFVTSALTTGGSPYSIGYVYAGDTNFVNVSDNTKSFTVNKIAATITLSNLNQTYDGTAKSVTVTTNPTGLSYSLTYNGSGTAPAAAGTYSLVATITNANYSGSTSGSLVIAKVTPAFSNLSAPSINSGVTPTSLGGTLKSGSLIPSGSVSITLNGVTQSAALDGSGNFTSSFVTSALTTGGSPYSISYVYAGDTNFINVSDTTKTFTVNKIAATITLSNLSQIYDGTAKSVTVTTNPAGLSYSLTYNGSGTAPTAAGTYSLVATITNANYSGSTSGALVIAKVTPAFSNLIAPSINSGVTPTSLGGTLKSGSLIPSGSVSITLNGGNSKRGPGWFRQLHFQLCDQRLNHRRITLYHQLCLCRKYQF